MYFIFPGRHLLVQFRSDGDGSGLGFKALLDTERVDNYRRRTSTIALNNTVLASPTPMRMIDNA